MSVAVSYICKVNLTILQEYLMGQGTTISVYEFMKKFPNEKSARLYLEKKRWIGNPVCPECGSTENQHKQKRYGKHGYYFCYHCKMTYSVRTGTIFERSHVLL